MHGLWCISYSQQYFLKDYLKILSFIQYTFKSTSIVFIPLSNYSKFFKKISCLYWFRGLRLLYLGDVPMPTIIQMPTFIRVWIVLVPIWTGLRSGFNISEHLNMNTAIWTWKILAFFQKIGPLLFSSSEHWTLNAKY